MATTLENIPTTTLVVAVALQDQRGLWLMQRRPPGKQHAGLWEFPGGKVERGESLEIAMIREAKEELAIELCGTDLRPAGFAEGRAEGTTGAIVILLYTTTRWSGVPEAQEGGEVRWCDAATLAALDCPPLDRELRRQLLGDCAE